MTTVLAVAADGLPIFDAAGQPLFQTPGGGVANSIGTVIDINPINGVPRDALGADISQPPLLMRVNALVAHATATVTATAMANPRVVPVTFARAPGRIDRNIIDYASKTGETLYKRATASLYDDGEGKFSLKDDDLLSFLSLLSFRAKNCGWDVFSIPITLPGITPVITKNLLNEYGEVTLEQVRAKAETIAAAKDRCTQEDEQLFSCLMASLTKAGRNTVNLRKVDFTIGDEHSGILLLKVVIGKSQVDTRSTIMLLMGKLNAGMANIMASHNNNITAFNAEINEIIQKLQSRGKGGADDLDLLSQLFVTYMSCGSSDTPFYRYIESLENKYIDGDITLTTKVLMDKAELKYEELKDKMKFTAANDKSPKANEGDIVALRAETVSKQRRRLPDWMTQKPTDGKLTKAVNGKSYHWCDGNTGKHHTPKWVIHHPSACVNQKKPLANGQETQNVHATQKGEAAPTWTTSMYAALQAEQE
jgi:hypothetical protein